MRDTVFVVCDVHRVGGHLGFFPHHLREMEVLHGLPRSSICPSCRERGQPLVIPVATRLPVHKCIICKVVIRTASCDCYTIRTSEVQGTGLDLAGWHDVIYIFD